MDSRIYEFKALSNIWTGDIDGKPGRLITTGLLGSIRWWFEVVVRGLGGSACDPSAQHKTCQDDKHCVACELFGCTGWARKFRFGVLDKNGDPQQEQITKDGRFKIQFTSIRPIRDEEWALLDLTLRLIADYGALGGKTVYKPTDQDTRKKEQHHHDFGIIEMANSPTTTASVRKKRLQDYVQDSHSKGRNEAAWASLEHFWCVNDRYLARETDKNSSFNGVLGRKEDKSVKERKGRQVVRWSDLLKTQDDAVGRWLSGGRGESKKVFSFEKPARTFGFVKPGTISHDDMLGRLKSVWPDMKDEEYLEGSAILDKLFKSAEVSS